ncbi:MAG: GxxExxY protein [Thermoplasmata archaeon]|nr:MAG: GxxExxY protein [Thermoplasmata archaeon]
MNDEEYQSRSLTGKVIGAAIEVHKILGPGFIESVYHNALKKELTLRGILYETEKNVEIFYKEDEVGEHRLDMLIENTIVVELKAVSEISDVHISQVVSYLKATELNVGLILNFSRSKLDIKRVISNR